MANVAQSVEYLVDLFLLDDPDLDGVNTDELSHSKVDDDDHDGETLGCIDMGMKQSESDAEFLRKKVGQDLKHSGDEFNRKYERVKSRTLKDDVKKLLDNQIQQAGGSPEVFWPQFRDLMDNAVKDTGLDDVNKVLAAVLVSVKGLGYLGSSIRILTLRYIGERKLDTDFKTIKLKNESDSHPSLD